MAGQTRIIVEALEGFIEKVVKSIVLDVVANLVRAPGEGGTPVDTGWARANWIPVIGRPSRGAAKGGSRADRLSGARQLQAQQETAIAAIATGYRLSMGAVFVANNVPYIVRLNEGSSKQAPAGFVQAAIIKAIKSDLAGKLGA